MTSVQTKRHSSVETTIFKQPPQKKSKTDKQPSEGTQGKIEEQALILTSQTPPRTPSAKRPRNFSSNADPAAKKKRLEQVVASIKEINKKSIPVSL